MSSGLVAEHLVGQVVGDHAVVADERVDESLHVRSALQGKRSEVQTSCPPVGPFDEDRRLVPDHGLPGERLDQLERFGLVESEVGGTESNVLGQPEPAGSEGVRRAGWRSVGVISNSSRATSRSGLGVAATRIS